MNIIELNGGVVYNQLFINHTERISCGYIDDDPVIIYPTNNIFYCDNGCVFKDTDGNWFMVINNFWKLTIYPDKL